MNWIFLLPLLMAIIFSMLVYKRIEKKGFYEELIFSSVLAGLFFGLFFWFFSMYFLSGLFYVFGGAFLESLMKSAAVHLRKDRRYSVFFGLGFGAVIPALSIFYSDLTLNTAICGILFSLASLLFHSSTSIKLSHGNAWNAIFLVFLLTIPYNLLLWFDYIGIMIISVFYSALIFRRYFPLLT